MNSSSNPCNSASHITRRTMLQATATGLGGLAWLTPVAHLLGRAQEKASAHAPAKSVIMLWMAGGPSQLETFDPHAGKTIAGDTRAINTSVKGVQFAHGLPQVAEVMHELTLVRSMVSKEGDHERATYNVKTGYRPDPTLIHPSIGAVLCHELPDAEMDIPRHISILPGQWPARGGYLGAQYDAFKVYNTNGRAGNITGRVQPKRLDNRLAALKQVEQSFARARRADLDAKTTLHNATIQKALRMMSSEQLSAFDITQAPAKIRADFGDTQFGRGCLAAIQLIGAGVRCVEVTLNGWDTHANNHEAHVSQNAILDPAFASLIRELRARRLLDQTIVICAGEFGRTPKINPASGRDHWPTGFSMALAGGGFRAGHVHGATDPTGAKLDPLDKESIRVADIHTTIQHTLGIDHAKELMTPILRPMALSDGQVIKTLLK
ncbi:MAG: DUF1501 domain-containing protein [Verrucomicrobiota bacterium]|nr:DUF1501 domain-containing protein [Verrucomicrobiota bacterium]